MRFRRRTWRTVVVGSALLVCALACAHGASAQLDQWGFWENGVTEHWWLSSSDFTAEDATNAVARWNQIATAKDDSAWDGDYFRGGETHGTYMRWSPSAGFVIAHVDKCAARVMGIVYGRAEATDGLVQFFPELDKESAAKHGGHGGVAPHAATPRTVLRFVPVEWRGQRLLIAEDEMDKFGDYVVGLGEYNGYDAYFFSEYANFFSRSGSEMKHDGRPPVVPPGYERFLKKPIEARIISVGRKDLKTDYTIEDEHTTQMFARAAVTQVTIDAGTEQGVKNKMVFRVQRPEEGDRLVVLRAGRRTSTAIVARDVDEHGAEIYFDTESNEKRHSKVARGWRLTTSPHN